MRSNNTVAMDSHALGTLNYIRASIDAAGAFAVPGTAGIAMGAVGLVAAGVASVPALSEHWLLIWLVAATVGAALGVILVARHRSGVGLPLYRGPARRFVPSETISPTPNPTARPGMTPKKKNVIGLKMAQRMPSTTPARSADTTARTSVVAGVLYVGMRRTAAQSRQRAPTGVWTRQRAQMYLPQRLQPRSVSIAG